MSYTFPLPKCRTHTYEWEDGPHDTCYRCGAEQPDKQEDRGALAKESTAALNTETMDKETDMHNHTDTVPTGTRITHHDTGERGTILGSIPDGTGILLTVAWDNPEGLKIPHALHTISAWTLTAGSNLVGAP